MNNPPLGVNYAPGFSSDIGELQVTINKKISPSKTREIKLRGFLVQVGMLTASNGMSTIMSCSSAASTPVISEFCRHHNSLKSNL